MKVVVFQCPCGAEATQRSPFGARPRVRVISVLAPVSSRNTSFAMSSVGWASIHARRAACTSSRACSLACRVFFKAQLPFIELMPQRRNFDVNAVFRQSLAHLSQRQIRLGLDPRTNLLFHTCDA